MSNKYLEGFDETKAKTYGLLVDANNLYGGIMQQFPLPLSEFEVLDVDNSTFFQTSNDSEIGFVLEVDLDYPGALHNMHKDFSVTPTKEKIDPNMLSECQVGLLDRGGSRRVTTPKLVETLFGKKNYTVHYISLKLFVDLSLSYQSTWGPSVRTRKVVGAIHQLEHENANSVEEQVRAVIWEADEYFLLR